uniref:Uncharacterized protein n=1 Tax=Arundo donax TaxID=35708 RepID=A0A0A9AGT0_ARUDO
MCTPVYVHHCVVLVCITCRKNSSVDTQSSRTRQRPINCHRPSHASPTQYARHHLSQKSTAVTASSVT